MAQKPGQMTLDDAAAQLGVDRTDVLGYLWERGLAAKYDTLLDAALFESVRKHFERTAGEEEQDDPRVMAQALREAPRSSPPEEVERSAPSEEGLGQPRASSAKAGPPAGAGAAAPVPGPRPVPARAVSFKGPRPAREPMPGLLSKPPEPECKEPKEPPKRLTGFDDLGQVKAGLPKGDLAAGQGKPAGGVRARRGR